jgi:small subunit ribosomal protein S2
MPVATRRELLEAGVHFGHQTRRWNPKMRRFIFGERSGIYIIDLEKTLEGLTRAYDFLLAVARRGGSVLFVGTKKQAQETVDREASRVNMPFVNTRWLGGMLTNFQTIHGRLRRLKELREMERSGAFEYLPKKEVLKLRHEKEKLERNLSGIQDMERLPDAIYVIDTKREAIAVKEARKLGIPVVAIVDTNCDPDEVDHVIPGNDDAIRACSLITKVVADALQEGQYLAYQGMQSRVAAPEFEREPAAAASPSDEGEPERRPIRLSEEEAAFFGSTVEEGAATGQGAGDEGVPAASVGSVDGSAESPTQDEAPSDTSAGWAAPKEPTDEEAPTVPDLTGAEAETTDDRERIEETLDRTTPAPARSEGGSKGSASGSPDGESGETEESGDTEASGDTVQEATP